MVAMSEMDYEKAYLREKQLRKQAEQLLEDRSRELFLTNEQLKEVNRNLQEQQQIVVQSEKMALSTGHMTAKSSNRWRQSMILKLETPNF